EEDHYATRVGPGVQVSQRQGDVTGFLRWSTLWEGFLETTDANNFEHFGNLRGSWRIDDRNTLQVSNVFAVTDSITSQLVVEDGQVVAPGQDVDIGTDSVLRNTAYASFTHRLTPRVSVEASVSNFLLNYEDEDRSDAISTRGSA